MAGNLSDQQEVYIKPYIHQARDSFGVQLPPVHLFGHINIPYHHLRNDKELDLQ